jgi:hypothetical protein
MNRQKLALNLFLASIAINALLGIWALLVGDFGDTQGKILATSFLISGAMLGVLVNGAPLERRVIWPVPLIAIVGSFLGFALILVPIWFDFDWDAWIKVIFSALTIGAGATFAGLLALLRLRQTHEVMRLGSYILIFVLCATIVGAIWGEGDADWVARTIGVESILAAASILSLPALARFLPPEPASDERNHISFCPRCGKAIDGADFGDPHVRCPHCDLTFSVRAIAEP